jgi:hypothetical protein
MGNWRNDADNTTKLKKLLSWLPKPVRTSTRWCALRTVPHNPVWVDVSIALWMLEKYDPVDAAVTVDLTRDVAQLDLVKS